MSDPDSAREREYLNKVTKELSRYSHPLFEWEARQVSPGVEVIVTLKVKRVYDEPYRLHLKPREIEARGFEWDFQRQLYNCLHDYLVEMFTRSPNIAEI
ncbi:MAG: hypothetical protein AABN34_17590 [Acidobacteriota bacterium]